MSHRVRVRLNLAAWAADPTVTAAEFDGLDAGQYAAIDGDAGGTWGPATVIEIGGAGLRIATTLFIKTGAELAIATGAAVDFDAGSTLGMEGDATVSAGGSLTIESGGDFTVVAGANVDVALSSGSSITVGSGAELIVAPGGAFVLDGAILTAVAPTTRHLLWQIPVASSQFLRLYSRARSVGYETDGLDLTFNAVWTGTQWASDSVAEATLYELIGGNPIPDYTGQGACMQIKHKLSTASPWNEDAWDSDWLILSPGNPAATSDPHVKNTICPKNTVKAWASLASDGAGNASASDAFGIAAVTIAGAEILVTMEHALVGGYCPMVGMTASGKVPYRQSIVSTTQFRVGFTDFTGAAIDPATTACTASLLVMGKAV